MLHQDKTPQTDHVMNTFEQSLFDLQLREEFLQKVIVTREGRGEGCEKLKTALAAMRNDEAFRDRLLNHLAQFTQEEQGNEWNRIVQEGFPPELFQREDNAVVDGPQTLQ